MKIKNENKKSLTQFFFVSLAAVIFALGVYEAAYLGNYAHGAFNLILAKCLFDTQND